MLHVLEFGGTKNKRPVLLMQIKHVFLLYDRERLFQVHAIHVWKASDTTDKPKKLHFLNVYKAAPPLPSQKKKPHSILGKKNSAIGKANHRLRIQQHCWDKRASAVGKVPPPAIQQAALCWTAACYG